MWWSDAVIQHTFGGDDKKTVVTTYLVDLSGLKNLKQMVFLVPVSQYAMGLAMYRKGMLMQDAFPFLSPNEREFLISGLLPSEFDDLFEDLPDEDCDEPPPPFGEP